MLPAGVSFYFLTGIYQAFDEGHSATPPGNRLRRIMHAAQVLHIEVVADKGFLFFILEVV